MSFTTIKISLISYCLIAVFADNLSSMFLRERYIESSIILHYFDIAPEYLENIINLQRCVLYLSDKEQRE